MKAKYIFTALAVIAAFMQAQAQITTTQISNKAPEATAPYDSSNNGIVLRNVRQYAGQQVFILPKSKLYPANSSGDAMTGYGGFTSSPVKSEDQKDVYKPVSSYKGRFNFISDYNALAGKYFNVLDVVSAQDVSNSEEGPGTNYFLKLQSAETKDIFYFYVGKITTGGNEYGAPEQLILFTGYFEKLKQTKKGRKFVANNGVMDMADINNGQHVPFPAGSVWTCTDLTLTDIVGYPDMIPIFVFRDSLGHEIAVGTDERWQGLKVALNTDFRPYEIVMTEKQQAAEAKAARDEAENKRVAKDNLERKQDAAAKVEANKERREKLIQKYGQEKGAIIADGHVQIGMTKQMCIDAWGKPSDINTTTTTGTVSEQWVYSMKSYLYFENGILTSIQN